jgi:lysozyme family protein
MTELFKKCVEVILKNEGIYSFDTDDPGGETHWGISKRVYPDLDILNLTREKAIQIYYDDYWLPLYLEGLQDEEAALQIFDFGVNAGIRKAARLAQICSGAYIDGIIGPATIMAINASECFVSKYKHGRIDFYCSIATGSKEKFLKGWIKRVEKTHF